MANEFSFEKGFSQVKRCDEVSIKERLMTALNITSRASWGARLKGLVEPKVSEAREIENIFADYGIKEVWGEAL